MAEREVPITDAHKQFLNLPKQFIQEQEAIIITADHEQVMAILPFTLYQEMQETIQSLTKTLEIMHDEKFMASFRLVQKGMKTDHLVPLEQIKKELGLED